MFKDKRDIILIILILIILLEGFCIYTTNRSIKVVCDEINNKPDIKFEIKSFDLTYLKDESIDMFYAESYKGKGIIAPSGDENLVKKDYLVLLQIVRTKGGLDTNTDKQQTENIVIHNGIGTFSTEDIRYDKKDKFSKPEYKFKILGYQEFKNN